VAEHDYEVSCECGARWRVRLETDEQGKASGACHKVSPKDTNTLVLKVLKSA